MQIIWNSQNNEKLFAIDEATLYQRIKQKGGSVEKVLNFVDLIMILVNLGVGFYLIFDSVRDGDQRIEFILPTLYLFYGVLMLGRRLLRKRQEVHFESTILGEIEQAIWRIDYIVKQGYGIIMWYLVPLTLVILVFTYFKERFWMGVFFALIVLPATYLATGWENQRWHLPKKRELEHLKSLLLSDAT